MLVKISDFPDDLAAMLKDSTAEATASKAVMTACYAFVSQRSEISMLRSRLALVEAQLERKQALIDSARNAAAQLLDNTGQMDLIGDDAP